VCSRLDLGTRHSACSREGVQALPTQPSTLKGNAMPKLKFKFHPQIVKDKNEKKDFIVYFGSKF